MKHSKLLSLWLTIFIPLLSLAAMRANATVIEGTNAVWGQKSLQSGQSLNQSTRQEIHIGLDALKKNDLSKAEAAFRKASALNPESATPLLGLAEVAARRHHLAKTESLLDKALSLEPKNAEVLRTVGRYRLLHGKSSEAEKLLKRALSLDPASVMGNMLLGDTYLKGLHDPAKAENFYQKSIKLDNKAVGAYMGLGAALATQGKNDQARQAYKKASLLAPKDPRPLRATAKLFASQGHFHKAIAKLNSAIKIDPRYLPAYMDKGDLLLLQGKMGAAASAYKAATKSTQEPAFAYFKLGVVMQAQEKWEKAQKYYLEATRHDPKMYAAYNNLAWMAALRKVNLDEATHWAKKAIKLSPRNSQLYDTLGAVYLAKGQVNQGITAYIKAVNLAPSHPEYHYRLGLAYLKKGNREKAREQMQQSLDLGVQFAGKKDAEEKLRDMGKE